MDKSTTQLLGFIGLLILFGFELVQSQDFKESFLNKRSRNRTVAYIITSFLVMLVLSYLSTIVKPLIKPIVVAENNPALDFLGVFLLSELLNWVFHYVKHSGHLWKFHFQHHIDRRYTMLLTTHTHGLEVIISATIISAFLSLFGFSEQALNVYFLFYSLVNTYQHSHAPLSLGWLDYIIVSPRYHRIHHSKSHRANYGSTITIWDIVFQTAIFPEKDYICEDIGIKQNGEPFGFIEESLYFLSIFDSKEDASSKVSSQQPVVHFTIEN